MQLVYWHVYITSVTVCRHHNEAWIPTLRLLHQFPFLLTPQMVDKGAIKFVLSGANIMCPGEIFVIGPGEEYEGLCLLFVQD